MEQYHTKNIIQWTYYKLDAEVSKEIKSEIAWENRK